MVKNYFIDEIQGVYDITDMDGNLVICLPTLRQAKRFVAILREIAFLKDIDTDKSIFRQKELEREKQDICDDAMLKRLF